MSSSWLGVMGLFGLTACAPAQQPETNLPLEIPIPRNAAPVLVLEDVEAPSDQGLRIEVLGTLNGEAGEQVLAVAGLVGSPTEKPVTQAMQLVIPLDGKVAATLSTRDSLSVRLRIQSIAAKPAHPTVKIGRAYFRTKD